jgi:hypothetical protein
VARVELSATAVEDLERLILTLQDARSSRAATSASDPVN